MNIDLVVPADVRTRLAVRFGPSAEAWCDALPELVAGLADRWGLTVLASGGGGTAQVFRCARVDGTAAWLKLTPDATVAAEKATALGTWAGLPSVVGLLGYEPEAGALLLADVRPGTLLRERGWQPADLGDLLTDLRAATPPADSTILRPLRERVDFLYGLTERRAPGRVPARVRAFALELADSGPLALVHGDLHPANVLAGPAGPVAIDPRPALGDPDFDLVDWAIEGIAGRDALDRRIAELCALVPGADPDRVLAWCRALAPVVAVPRAAAGRRDERTGFLWELAGLEG
ncbi:aminoglycoside phosphotransferase family protein [Kitasatospora sp. NPDC004240]